MNKYTKLLLGALLSLSTFLVRAQNNDTLEIQRNEKGKILFGLFQPNANMKMQDGEIFLKNVLQAKQDDELRLTKENKDELGITHRRYQQYYKGIKVENAEYLIHGKNESIETINGDFQDINISSVIPSINEILALSKALKFVNSVNTNGRILLWKNL